MLHTVNKSVFERNSLQSCVNTIDDTSVILLIEDGVISAAKNTKSSVLADLAAQGRVYALQGDVDARGISSKVADNIKLVDYEGFVDLVVEHGTAVSWL
ncbi:sulfurtransferase complex subunit TusB [Bathymodiolus septemdierum thioautotrophic gill symbiont]|uniref:Intracellular sulfur oxidation protein DsrH n=1 Tax=endosymbiont of Bathymodiolus septemdierum str. Myojin knoll TaxID=1303921 RepID=A0A0P0UTK2_9GAMM|nr:sulfurtransferase complex subunit TusB [Bathymodiolus septemdierum thioautotrophic gill symbiont]BAS68241.1 intracellular sulfur oxidation protein DsrH [endosymbiont of Bathymodiolus septemdierum str. Myojin knoll]